MPNSRQKICTPTTTKKGETNQKMCSYFGVYLISVLVTTSIIIIKKKTNITASIIKMCNQWAKKSASHTQKTWVRIHQKYANHPPKLLNTIAFSFIFKQTKKDWMK